MAKIQVMSDLLANKIAAGEVVERPASVVKELLENSLDAGATEILIELQQAGLEMIRVADNGSGIDSSDVPLAFERHATSKILDDKDLFRIQTLGFRGEALPSIAAVSRLQIKTRTSTEQAGTCLHVEAGRITDSTVSAAKQGTEISVQDLFFNTPARLKYLKSMQTELGHVVDFVEKMALARPEVAFRLYHNDRLLLQTPGDGVILHAAAAVYGRELVKQMASVAWENYDYRITGLAGFPELNRANRNHCTFFVNGRYIKSYLLFQAVVNAYHTLLPINRYPVCILHIQLDPSLVDVNVHPTKLEVRFSEEKDLSISVQQAIRSALEQHSLVPKAVAKQIASERQPQTQQTPLPQTSLPQTQPEQPAFGSKQRMRQPSLKFDYPARVNGGSSDPKAAREAAIHLYQTTHTDQQTAKNQIHGENQSTVEPSAPFSAEATAAAKHLPDGTDESVMEEAAEAKEAPAIRFRPIAQALGMYVIAESVEGLYIIDQHAAHEKVLYEKFRNRLREKQIHPLPLLVPLTLELSSSESEKLVSQMSILSELCIEVEQFGRGSFLIRSVPDIWDGLDTQRLTAELIDELLMEQVKDPRALIEDKIIMKACKSAIKANRWLSMQEMNALCEQLAKLENPYTCPHGRPIIIHMSTYDLEKQFKRVM